MTPRPSGDRAEEARVCREILQAVERRRFAPQVVACRLRAHDKRFFRRLAAEIEDDIEREMPRLARPLCGRGKFNHRRYGLRRQWAGRIENGGYRREFAGAGENPVAPGFVDGRKVAALKGDAIAADFKRMLGEYIETRFAPK